MDYQYELTDTERITIALENQFIEKVKLMAYIWFENRFREKLSKMDAKDKREWLLAASSKVINEYELSSYIGVKKITDNTSIGKLESLTSILPNDIDIEDIWIYQEKCGFDVDGLYIVWLKTDVIMATCKVLAKYDID